MEYVYSALVLHAAGKEVTEDGVSSVLKAAGVTPDTARIKALTASLEGVDIKDVLSKAAVMPAGPAGPAPAGDDKGGKKPEEEEKKEEKVSEDEAAAGLGALFG